MAVNPFCEIAIEEAVRLKESGQATEVIAVAVGPASARSTAYRPRPWRRPRHPGRNRRFPTPVRRQTPEGVYDQEQPGLVILGKQSIDADNNQTGQMFAALTGLGQGTFAQVEIAGDTANVAEVDGGLQIALKAPAVVTTDLRLNEPRYASLPNIMKAKKKPLDTLTPEALGVEIKATIETLRVEPPAERQGGIKVDSVEALVDKLKNEAKVI